VLDILVQSRRNKAAAKRFFRKLLKGLQDVPGVVITDKLASYGAAKREALPRTRTSPRGSASGACGASSVPATPSGSLPVSATSPIRANISR